MLEATTLPTEPPPLPSYTAVVNNPHHARRKWSSRVRSQMFTKFFFLSWLESWRLLKSFHLQLKSNSRWKRKKRRVICPVLVRFSWNSLFKEVLAGASAKQSLGIVCGTAVDQMLLCLVKMSWVRISPEIFFISLSSKPSRAISGATYVRKSWDWEFVAKKYIHWRGTSRRNSITEFPQPKWMPSWYGSLLGYTV